MATRALRNRDDPIDVRFQRLDRVSDGRRIVKNKTAIGVDRVDDLAGDAESRDDDGRLVLDRKRQVRRLAWIGAMNPEHRRERRRALIGQTTANFDEPSFKPFRRPLIKGRKCSDHARLACLDDEVWPGDQEQRRGHHRELQPLT